MPNSRSHIMQRRILDTATVLFSASGFNGVSMRDIARLAAVNETSIYLYYRGKRELFIAALDAEMGSVKLEASQKSRLASSSDAHSAILALFHVIIEAVSQRPVLVRLVQFSLLEYSEDLDDLYRRHIHHILQGAREYLKCWPELEPAKQFENQAIIFAFVASFVALTDFLPKMSGDHLSQEVLQEAASACAELWHSVLSSKSNLHSSID